MEHAVPKHRHRDLSTASGSHTLLTPRMACLFLREVTFIMQFVYSTKGMPELLPLREEDLETSVQCPHEEDELGSSGQCTPPSSASQTFTLELDRLN